MDLMTTWSSPSSPVTTTGVLAILPTARMADSGGLMMATKSSRSNIPREDTVKVPPW